MKVVLKGYFDSNFGDDYMMRIIVRALPEFHFVVQEDNQYTQFILQEENVSVNKTPDKELPVLIVIGCGFMINTRAALQYEIRAFLRGYHPGDYCLGCNIEPYSNKVKEFLIKRKFRKFKLVVCRDIQSYDWLTRANLKNTKIYHLPDMLFSMPDEWIKKQENPDKLGISLWHRIGDKEDCGYYKSMAKAADYWVEKTGKEVYLMAFDTGREEDAIACRCVKDFMRYPHMAKIILHGKNDEILIAFSECKKIIGARFHSAVLAMKMGIDFFFVVYREKMKNLMKNFDYPIKGCCIDDINLEEIKRFIDSDGVDFKLNEKVVKSANLYPRIFREEYEKNRGI